MAEEWPGEPIGARNGKKTGLVDHCVYQIATGAWAPGSRVPSVREAEQRWQVNRLTVLRAYRELADMGLLRAVDRSGYFVSDTAEVNQVARHRDVLLRLYDDFVKVIRRRTSFAPLGVFRYLTHVAQAHLRERPDVAFVECTSYQAAGHAREIFRRLQVPVVPVTLNQMAADPAGLPPGVRVLLTTAWHLDEVHDMPIPPGVKVISVPVEIANDLALTLPSDVREATIVDTSKSEIAHFRPDVKRRLSGIRVRTRLVRDVVAALPALLNEDRQSQREKVYLLAPRFWGVIDDKLRQSDRVWPIGFRIVDTSWQAIAAAVGMPWGSVDSG